jgi:hypothetical protein
MDYKDLKISKMDIKILGTGCPKCKTLESLTPRCGGEKRD